jgi:hypothetical protein
MKPDNDIHTFDFYHVRGPHGLQRRWKSSTKWNPMTDGARQGVGRIAQNKQKTKSKSFAPRPSVGTSRSRRVAVSDRARTAARQQKQNAAQKSPEKQVLCAAAVGRHEQKQASCRLGSGAHGGPSAETERCTKVT